VANGLADQLLRPLVHRGRIDQVEAAVEQQVEDARDAVLIGLQEADGGRAEAESRHL